MKKNMGFGGNWDTDLGSEVDLQAKNEQKRQSKALHVEKTSRKGYDYLQK
ncbi:MAG: hypothetical protein JXB29_06000 [Sedimentisphaerales bacterium]|nr:hypothetical protein [Sedimentisphaerales bacterium]